MTTPSSISSIAKHHRNLSSRWNMTHGAAPLLPLILLLLVFLAHGPALDNGFVDYDDPHYVTENPQVRQGLAPESIAWAFGSVEQGNWHPLTWLSHMLVVELHGLDPFWHHFHNLLLHGCNVLLLFFLLRRMTGSTWRSAAVAALFAAHPLHVESVVWVSERKDVLSTLFALLCLHAYARYAQSLRLGWYLGAFGCLALGLMAKPMLVTMPLLMLLLDFWPLGRFTPAPAGGFFRQHRVVFLEKLPFILLVLGVSAISLSGQDTAGALAPLSEFGVWQRAANVLTSYVAYLGTLFIPVGLAPLYPLAKSIPLLQPLASGAFLALTTILLLRLARRAPWLCTGWFWYLIAMLPVIGIVQVGVQSMADRYTYLPFLGLYLALVWGACSLPRTWPRQLQGAALVALALCLGACIFLSRQQARLWKDTITLFEHTVAVTDNNHLAHRILGKAWLERQDLDAALGHYLELLRLRPHDPDSHWFVCNILLLTGEHDQALERMATALERFPDSAMLLKLSGVIRFHGRDLPGAKQDFARALELAPEDQEARKNLLLVTQELDGDDSGKEIKERGE